MVIFRFFVHCDGWQDGGYENVGCALSEREARELVRKWNEKAMEQRQFYKDLPEDRKSGLRTPSSTKGNVDLLDIVHVTDEEFAEDYIPCFA